MIPACLQTAISVILQGLGLRKIETDSNIFRHQCSTADLGLLFVPFENSFHLFKSNLTVEHINFWNLMRLPSFQTLSPAFYTHKTTSSQSQNLIEDTAGWAANSNFISGPARFVLSCMSGMKIKVVETTKWRYPPRTQKLTSRKICHSKQLVCMLWLARHSSHTTGKHFGLPSMLNKSCKTKLI